MTEQKKMAFPDGNGKALTDSKVIGGAQRPQLDSTTIKNSAQLPPPPLPVILGNIPEALKAFPQWVCWHYKLRGKKWSKPPCQPNGKPASKTNPAHFSDFSDVAAAYEEGGFSGIGFVLTDNDQFVAIDIDHCLEGDKITDEAKAIIDTLNSYTEISPSGHGIRIFVKGTIPRNIHKGIEIYSHDSYVTVTGQRWQA